jgi:hypothetical protein
MFNGVASALFVFLLFTSIVHDQDLAGEWSGTVYQTGPDKEMSTYPAKMVLGEYGPLD